MMGHTNQKECVNDCEFSREELASLRPNDTLGWMCQQTFGTPDPGRDANPTNARSSAIAFWKKAISFHMPNKLMPWNVITSSGNPTKSIEVNDLIKRVKKRRCENKGLNPRHDVP